jgi:hypothetical protein
VTATVCRSQLIVQVRIWNSSVAAQSGGIKFSEQAVDLSPVHLTSIARTIAFDLPA